jgi:acetylornithine deacetylase/succinyl-diaminopimelate desuccinylase-like protein
VTRIEAAINEIKAREEQALAALDAFLRIPSISTSSEHAADVARAAEWCAATLRELGCQDAEIIPTDGHPILFASWMTAAATAPTILIYGHTDVQPTDPIEEWQNDPFTPEIRGENIFARGATDMKAQIVAFFEALRAILATSELPLNVKFLLEGEEEVGSPNLESFVRSNAELLACDVCVNLDAGILAPDTPSLQCGLRGLSYFELHLQGPAADLHSGKFGGAIENPALVLCELIAGMRDSDGLITLPGFYEEVRQLSDADRAEMAALPLTEQWWLEKTGAPALRQGMAYTATERATARPTLDVNGIYSGFSGEGSKTVLPAKASAKISMRLVPDQTPEQVRQSLLAYLNENVPPTVAWELITMTGALPGMIERESQAVVAATKALEEVWGSKPRFTRDGGTVPVVNLLKEQLGVDSLLFGFGLPDDNPHAPNEKQHLPTFFRGIETYVRFLHAYGDS